MVEPALRPDAADPLCQFPVEVMLLNPRGFCAGVRRAINAVTDALDHFGAPVYVRRAIVHNLAVVRTLEDRGAIFVKELDEVPEGSVAILSAHGVGRHVHQQAKDRGLRAFDAICPLVAKVHKEVLRHHAAGRHILLIGHREHPEIAGTLGQLAPDRATVVSSVEEVEALSLAAGQPLAYAVQTTFSIDEAAAIISSLEGRFSNLAAPLGNDICYATTNRQAAVKAIAPDVDALLIVGEDFSSNARRLGEVAAGNGCPSVQLVAEPGMIEWPMLEGCRSIAISAAASTPEASVQAVVAALANRFEIRVREVGTSNETAIFRPVLRNRPIASLQVGR